MVRVPLFGAGIKGRSAVVSAQRRINCYYDPQPDEDRTRFAVRGTPGLVSALDLGGAPIKGVIADGALLYLVQAGALKEVNNAFIATTRGTFAGSPGRMDIASNGAVLVLVDGLYGYTYTIATQTLAQITDPDFPPGPTTVTWQDGFFVCTFAETGPVKQRVYVSPDGSTWDALDFRSAESAPDGLLRVSSDHGELHLFGEITTEFWGYTGDVDFPFAPIRGATLEIGLAARWSLAKFDQSFCFLGRNRLGEVQVYRLSGYQAQMISTPDLSYILNGYQTTLDATAFAYQLDGHPMYEISFPSAGATWLYDGLASAALGVPVWSEVTSDGGRHFAELQTRFLGRNYVTDHSAGRLYRMDKDVYDDNGVHIERQIDTRHFFKDYDRVTVDRIVFDFESGIGLSSGQGSDPQAMLRVSRDGGRTFGNEMHADIGPMGEYSQRVEFRRLGTARDFVFSLRVTDPVKFCVTGAAIDAQSEMRQVA